MKTPYLIQSLPDGQGRFWAAALNADESYSVGWLRKTGDAAVRVSRHLNLGATLSRIRDSARYDKLELDWSSLKIPVGELIVVETETKDAARAEVNVFSSDAAYNTFRRERLALYSDNNEDAAEVAATLAAGNLELAWEIACDDDGSKELWRSQFGSHSVEHIPNLIAFTDLPGWYQNTIKDAL